MRVYLMLFALLFAQITLAQHKLSCCAHPSEEFAMFSKNENFVNAHAAPEPFVYSEDLGEWLTYETSDGKESKAFSIWAEKKTHNWILVFHEWWGLNDYMRQMSAQIFKDVGNVNVLAVDLFDGKTADNKEDAANLMESAERERVKAIVEGALRIIGNDTKVATIGWCYGGGWALQAAIMAGDRAVGCVMYYGMPETDVEKLKKLETDVLGIFAEKDDWVDQDIVEEFEKNMKAAGKSLNIMTYDAVHAFANPSNPKHDEENTQDAYEKVLAYLKKKFKD